MHLDLADWRDVEQYGPEQLTNGSDLPSDADLAGVSALTERLADVVNDALAAVGEQPPDDVRAASVVAARITGRICARSLDALTGARSLWRLARRVPPCGPQLRVFIGLVGECDDDPAHRLLCEQDIIEAACRWTPQ